MGDCGYSPYTSYPAIASRIFLNLNRIQAQRQAERNHHFDHETLDSASNGDQAGQVSSFDSALNPPQRS